MCRFCRSLNGGDDRRRLDTNSLSSTTHGRDYRAPAEDQSSDRPCEIRRNDAASEQMLRFAQSGNLRLVFTLVRTITVFRRLAAIGDIVNGKAFPVDNTPNRAEMYS
jgi:hypothetical protein